jgi:hypothetical protein
LQFEKERREEIDNKKTAREKFSEMNSMIFQD